MKESRTLSFSILTIGSKRKATRWTLWLQEPKKPTEENTAFPITSNLSPKEVNVDEYDALIIPGGRAPDGMRINKGLVDIVREANEKGKVIAAVCHGPQMLIEADILRGKKATCWKSVTTDLKNAGAKFIDAPAVVDGNIVTSRFPADLPKFCQETIKLLKKS